MKLFFPLILSTLTALAGIIIKIDYREYSTIGNILLILSTVCFYYFVYLLVKKIK